MQKEKSKLRIYGIRPVSELLDSNKEIQKIYIQKNLKNDSILKIEKKAKNKNVEIKYIPPQKLNRLTKKNHQGIFAFCAPISFVVFENYLPQIYEKGEIPIFILLDRITDVRNFGAICRTSEALGVHGIIIPKKETAEINEISVKTSSGALTKLPICRTDNLINTLVFAKNSGLQICSLSEHAKKNIFDVKLKKPSILVLGSEEKGISKKILSISDEIIKIPTTGEIISLNVSVATGIVLTELKRQRLFFK